MEYIIGIFTMNMKKNIELLEGDEVEFETQKTDKGMEAINIVKL